MKTKISITKQFSPALSLCVLCLICITAMGQTEKENDTAIYKAVTPAVYEQSAELKKEKPVVVEQKVIDAEKQSENYLINSPNSFEPVTHEDMEEIQFMQNLNRGRDINSAIMQLDVIEKELLQITIIMKGIDSTQMASDVITSNQIDLQT